MLTLLASDISADLAQAVSSAFAAGTLPSCLKESTTLALRKEGKKDYSLPGSYRPIALENALAKVVEKILANRISEAAETHNLLPWNQMGARKDRSTLSAIGLLTTCVQTAWKAKPGCTVSMLSLDLAGAFDMVSHSRLLDVLTRKGLPQWLVSIIASFLQARRTRLVYTGYESSWINVQSGIPQGSPLSPILFLFFISGLLEQFSTLNQGVLGFGFVDDTNLIAVGPSAADNCQRLSRAHDQCKDWAQSHGAVFAPDKYQLIHFTRRRRHAAEDLASTINIDGHQIALEKKAIRVLGVWLDPKLTWTEHITHAARKGAAASDAAARLATSTWGPSMRHTRLLYTAIARPTLCYGIQEWGIGPKGNSIPSATINPLVKVQNRCLRQITGAYKRTSRALLERETRIPPLSLYSDVLINQALVKTRRHDVEKHIARSADAVWAHMHPARTPPQRPPTHRELARQLALTRCQNEREKWARARPPAPHRRRRPPKEPDDAALATRWCHAVWQTQ